MTSLTAIHSPLIDKSRWTSDVLPQALLSSGTLKIIATMTILINYISVLFLPVDSDIGFFLCLIGQIAFPVCAFLITEEYLYTQNKGNLLFKLMLFALISEIPYNLAFNNSVLYIEKQNLFFELAISLFGIYVYEKVAKNWNKLLALICILILSLIAETTKFEYGALGLIVTLVMYLFRSVLELRIAVFSAVVLVYTYSIYSLSKANIFEIITSMLTNLNIYMILGAVPVACCNGKKEKNIINEYFFYAFYPAQFFILYLIKAFV